MKKVFMVIVSLVMTLSASAQFEQGKMYLNTSLTGLDLSYSGVTDLHLGFEAKGGYLVEDNWMVLGQAGIDTQNGYTALNIGVGGRYYIIQNGIYLGANASYRHGNGGYNDFMPGIEVGYAFFINHYVTIEPAIYYNQSLKNHGDYSTIGLKVGIGLYK